MKSRLNLWVVLSVIIAGLCVGLAVHVHNEQEQSKKQLSVEQDRTVQAKKQYQQAAKQPINELPSYSKDQAQFNSFIQASLKKINHKTDGTPYLEYGTPNAYEAVSLLFENGESDAPKVRLKDEHITFNEIDNAMQGLGTMTFTCTYGKKSVDQKLNVYVELSKSGYVNELKFGTFVPDEGSKEYEEDK